MKKQPHPVEKLTAEKALKESFVTGTDAEKSYQAKQIKKKSKELLAIIEKISASESQ
ncbi:MAG: hypothetical protein ACFFD4_02985 [Candidatus Odinarchaeota archaeon]